MLHRVLLAIVGASVLAACDVGGKGAVTGVVTPSSIDDLVATIALSPFISIPAAGLPCVAPAQTNLAFDIAISTSRTVDLNRVTLRVGDGTHVGGPSITFPTAFLAERFETTVIPAASTRVLTFNPPFGCVVLPSNLVFADIFLTDSFGSSRLITVSTSLR
jgi:hypothetical protein